MIGSLPRERLSASSIYGRWSIVDGGVRSDEQGPLCAGNVFAANHVRPVEARGFDYPSLGTLPNDQAQSPLRSPVCVDHSMGAHTYVAQVVLSVKRVCNLCLHHNHQVIVPELHGPGGLGGVKVTAVPDFVSSNV